MQQPAAFEKYRGEIDAELRSALDGRDQAIYDMVRYHLGWVDERGYATNAPSGKALRPTLCLLACEALGGDRRLALPAAAAVELAHNFSLVHDDIQDRDRERRHRPTVWAIWGEAQAINAGSAMRNLADVALRGISRRGAPIAKELACSHLLVDACLRILEGQYLDISFESRDDVRLDEYLDMIDHKTAALISCAMEMGALIATDDQEAIGALRDFGRYLGLAFQIRDDVLGIWGDEKETGKPFASDIRQRKKSFPLVFALDKAEERDELKRLYASPDEIDVERVLAILDGVGAREAAELSAEELGERALAELSSLTLDARVRAELDEVAGFLAKRRY